MPHAWPPASSSTSNVSPERNSASTGLLVARPSRSVTGALVL